MAVSVYICGIKDPTSQFECTQQTFERPAIASRTPTHRHTEIGIRTTDSPAPHTQRRATEIPHPILPPATDGLSVICFLSASQLVFDGV
jgi:hypothetical protein